jgi:hypothetical protein
MTLHELAHLLGTRVKCTFTNENNICCSLEGVSIVDRSVSKSCVAFSRLHYDSGWNLVNDLKGKSVLFYVYRPGSGYEQLRLNVPDTLEVGDLPQPRK